MPEHAWTNEATHDDPILEADDVLMKFVEPLIARLHQCRTMHECMDDPAHRRNFLAFANALFGSVDQLREMLADEMKKAA